MQTLTKELALGNAKSDNIVRNLQRINAMQVHSTTHSCFVQSIYTAIFDDIAVIIVHNTTRLGIDDVSVTFSTTTLASKAAAVRFYKKLKAALT